MSTYKQYTIKNTVYFISIYPNGTTIEEVREYHRGTLKLCIEKSNTQEKKILLEEEQKKRERMSESDHIKKVFRN